MNGIIRQFETILERGRASGMLGQLIRFAIAGVISTGIYTAVYLPLSAHVFAPKHAVFAVPFAFAVAVVAGFFLHSAWSFKGHGTRDTSGRQHAKFIAVQGFGLVLNALFTWILTGPFHQPNWVPLIPVVLVTPIATFALNRQWVFG